MKCLLVEDDQALARELSQALQDGDWIVELAENGQEADFLVRTEAYDTVILDIGLPDGDGTRWLSSWREDGIDLPVLILTARERWADKAAGFTAGADDYVTKPFSPRVLIARIRAVLRRQYRSAIGGRTAKAGEREEQLCWSTDRGKDAGANGSVYTHEDRYALHRLRAPCGAGR